MNNLSVLHIAITPLAGSPIRIVDALRKHTDIKARLLVLDPDAYGKRTFAGDLDWANDKEEALHLIRNSDIMHFHHYFEFSNNRFRLDFLKIKKKGTKFIRQFHSAPLSIAHGDTKLAKLIVQSTTPQLVIPHYPERYYPLARVVPNIIPINDELYTPQAKHNAKCVSIYFAPSTLNPMWTPNKGDTRWDTKGYEETKRLLEYLKYRSTIDIAPLIRHDIPHTMCLSEKRQSDIAIDDMATGSFHISSFESLSQGIPTFSFLDERSILNIVKLTGSTDLPWMNFRLEDAAEPILELVNDFKLRADIGKYSRQWMLKYYDDKDLVQHYVSAYHDLVESPERLGNARFDPSSMASNWMAQRSHDLIWESRRNHFLRLEKKDWFTSLFKGVLRWSQKTGQLFKVYSTG